jgi:rhodanese-related sulfurtransferase
MMNRLFGSMFGGGQAGNVHMVSPATVREWLDAGQAVLIDVRETNEHAAERIKGAINLPLSTFEVSQLPPIPEGSKLVFHCRSGQRCGMTAAKAVAAGYTGEINRMDGGIMGWRGMGFPVE